MTHATPSAERPHARFRSEADTLPYQIVGTLSPSARVVLYTSSCDSQIAVKALGVLRDFAERMGWSVVHELYDLAPLDLPRRRRTGWLTIEHALSRGDADGVIAPAEQEIAWHPGDRTALRVWLLEASAFAIYPQPAGRPCAGPGEVLA